MCQHHLDSNWPQIKKSLRASQLFKELRSDCQGAHASADGTMSTLNRHLILAVHGDSHKADACGDMTMYLRHPNSQVDNGMRSVNHEHGSMRNNFALIHWQSCYSRNGRSHLPWTTAEDLYKLWPASETEMVPFANVCQIHYRMIVMKWHGPRSGETQFCCFNEGVTSCFCDRC